MSSTTTDHPPTSLSPRSDTPVSDRFSRTEKPLRPSSRESSRSSDISSRSLLRSSSSRSSRSSSRSSSSSYHSPKSPKYSLGKSSRSSTPDSLFHSESLTSASPRSAATSPPNTSGPGTPEHNLSGSVYIPTPITNPTYIESDRSRSPSLLENVIPYSPTRPGYDSCPISASPDQRPLSPTDFPLYFPTRIVYNPRKTRSNCERSVSPQPPYETPYSPTRPGMDLLQSWTGQYTPTLLDNNHNLAPLSSRFLEDSNNRSPPVFSEARNEFDHSVLSHESRTMDNKCSQQSERSIDVSHTTMFPMGDDFYRQYFLVHGQQQRQETFGSYDEDLRQLPLKKKRTQ